KGDLSITTVFGFNIYASPSEQLTQELFFSGSCNTFLSYFILSHLKPGQSAWDVGAEKGWFTLVMANAVGKTGNVVSFEPLPENYSRLKRNIDLNQFNWVETVSSAVSSNVGQSNMVPPKHVMMPVE